MTDWVGALCRLPLTFRAGGATIMKLFEPARPCLTDRSGFLNAVTDQLRTDVHLIDAWHGYSLNKRTSRGPYFGHQAEPLEVGFYDSGFHDVQIHADPAAACADFIYREAVWVLTRERMS